MISCIYAITNTATGEQYIGATIDVRRRVREHLAQLRQGTHPSKLLQAAYQGARSSFEITILEHVEHSNELAQREQYWQNKRLQDTRTHGYNAPDEKPYQLTGEELRRMEWKSLHRWNFPSDEAYNTARAELHQLHEALEALKIAADGVSSPEIVRLRWFQLIDTLLENHLGLNLLNLSPDPMPPLEEITQREEVDVVETPIRFSIQPEESEDLS